jgi:hypothetical protein
VVKAVEEQSDRKTQGVALNIAMGIDRDEIQQAILELLGQMTRHPRALAEVWTQLMTDSMAITLGFSTLDIMEDKRFSDPAWVENPFYKRIGQ